MGIMILTVKMIVGLWGTGESGKNLFGMIV